MLVATARAVARAHALEHEDPLGGRAVRRALELARGRPRGRQKPGELALREYVLVAPVAQRQLARGVELLVAGRQDDGADGDILVPCLLLEVDGVGGARGHARLAVRANGAVEAALG